MNTHQGPVNKKAMRVLLRRMDWCCKVLVLPHALLHSELAIFVGWHCTSRSVSPSPSPKSKIKGCICKANSWRVTAWFEKPTQASGKILPSSVIPLITLFHPRITAHSPDGWWATTIQITALGQHWLLLWNSGGAVKWAARYLWNSFLLFSIWFTTRILIRAIFHVSVREKRVRDCLVKTSGNLGTDVFV